jgi:hypothetical protein
VAEPSPQLPPGYRIELFAEQDTVRHEELIEMWERDGAVPPAVSGRRVHQVLFVAISPDGEPASVNSAYLERDPQLAMDLWFIRTFTARDHRMRNLGLALLLRARDHFDREFAEGRETRGSGLGFEIENVGLRVHGDATGYPVGATFVGINHRGNPLWVRYFPGVLVPEPPS